MSVLTIYTNSFPYGTAETFLESEMKYLSLNFKEIFIVPFWGNGEMRIVPENVRVLSPIQEKEWPTLSIYFAGIKNFMKFHEIPELKKELRIFSFFKCLKYLGYAILTKNSLLKKIQYQSSVHYSYWLNFSAFALTLIKLEGKTITVISRAHGYDLYEERGEKSLAFIRAATLKNLDKLYFISNHGRNYLVKKFPEFSGKYQLSRLGTTDPEFINPVPEKNSFTLVSCSEINPNKRVYLILESLILFRTKFPAINVKWYHLGSGEDIIKFVEKADRFLKNTSIQCIFKGRMTNTEIFNFYRSVPVDLFVNVSKNEGVPVSIMEAQSFSIPVAATNTGGTSEIVNDENGLLLSQNPTPDELADIFHNIYESKEVWKKKRLLSRKNWQENFDAKKNYRSFAEELLSLI